MKFAPLALAGALLAIAAGPAGAQAVGVGITKGTAIGQMGAAIASTVSSHAGLQMRTQAMGGTQKYIEVVNGGELEFGIANLMQTYMAVTGTGISEGHKFENLRMVATLMAFRNGLLVANDSDIKTPKDLKGKLLPYGFNAAPLFRYFIDAVLMNGGLSIKDATQVPAVGLAQSWNLLKQGKVAGVITAVGAGPTAEMDATVPGGTRFIDMVTTGPAAEKTLAILPNVYFTVVEPGQQLAGIRKPTNTFGYDFGLFAHKDVPADVVRRVVKAMYENPGEIKSTAAMWATWDIKNMGKDQRMAYHPGAEEFYKKAGVWKR
ncbi:MAG: TAXI family TRAP transporter solute-binding subunit [Rhodospirillales bacterium]